MEGGPQVRLIESQDCFAVAVWTAVQVGSILRRVGHFAGGRSIKQQTNNKQQAKLTPSRQRPKGGRGNRVCLSIEPVIGVKLRLVDREGRFCSWKNFFRRWIFSGGEGEVAMSGFERLDRLSLPRSREAVRLKASGMAITGTARVLGKRSSS